MVDYDSPWKEAMDRHFAAFVAFFFPVLFARIDWLQDCEPLDTELRKLVPAGTETRRYIDRLVRAFRKESGDARLVHVEVQCQVEDDFEWRMNTYNTRIEAAYGQPVLTYVVLGDDNPKWQPGEYVFEEAGVRRTLKFVTVKLLDYADKLDQVEANQNPFGLFVSTHLAASRTRGDVPARKLEKLRLFRLLYDREKDQTEFLEWGRYFDWMLPLPEQDEKDVNRLVQAFEKEKQMPYVMSAVRFGIEEAQVKLMVELISNMLGHRPESDRDLVIDEVKSCEDFTKLRRAFDAVAAAKPLDEIRALLK